MCSVWAASNTLSVAGVASATLSPFLPGMLLSRRYLCLQATIAPNYVPRSFNFTQDCGEPVPPLRSLLCGCILLDLVHVHPRATGPEFDAWRWEDGNEATRYRGVSMAIYQEFTGGECSNDIIRISYHMLTLDSRL